MRRGEVPSLFGVLGDPVDHSLSPAMHNAAFAATALPHLYLRYRVPAADLADALRDARALAMRGLNLTVPLKEAALPLMDAVTPEADRIGAVNTIVVRGGRLVGDNTDGRGFVASLRGRVRLPGAHAVVVGAGGSARAVATALAAARVGRLTIVNRTIERADTLAARLSGPVVEAGPLAWLHDAARLGDAALVVNTTSTGLQGAPIPVRHAATPRGCLFVDLVYGARPTAFLAAAARAGRPTLDGAPMLLHQGALAFEAWTGRPAPLAVMAAALRDAGLALTRPAGAPSLRPARRPLA
jgi:shikimate dehydrogenase